MFSKPGTVIPANVRTQVGNAIKAAAPIVAAAGDLYSFESTKSQDATYYDVVKWTPASNNWVVESSYSCGSGS
jgi:hypothetical protein